MTVVITSSTHHGQKIITGQPATVTTTKIPAREVGYVSSNSATTTSNPTQVGMGYGGGSNIFVESPSKQEIVNKARESGVTSGNINATTYQTSPTQQTTAITYSPNSAQQKINQQNEIALQQVRNNVIYLLPHLIGSAISKDLYPYVKASQYLGNRLFGTPYVPQETTTAIKNYISDALFMASLSPFMPTSVTNTGYKLDVPLYKESVRFYGLRQTTNSGIIDTLSLSYGKESSRIGITLTGTQAISKDGVVVYKTSGGTMTGNPPTGLTDIISYRVNEIGSSILSGNRFTYFSRGIAYNQNVNIPYISSGIGSYTNSILNLFGVSRTSESLIFSGGRLFVIPNTIPISDIGGQLFPLRQISNQDMLLGVARASHESIARMGYSNLVVTQFQNLFINPIPALIPNITSKVSEIQIPNLTSTITQKQSDLMLIPISVTPLQTPVQTRILQRISTNLIPTQEIPSPTSTISSPSPVNPFPFIPIFPVPNPLLPRDSEFKPRKFRGKRKYRYTPSYEAFIFKIKGKKPKGIETGARIRPITKGWKFFTRRRLKI